MNFATYDAFKAAVSPRDSELVKYDWCRCPRCKKEGYEYDFEQEYKYFRNQRPLPDYRFCADCDSMVDAKVVPTGQYLTDFVVWIFGEDAL